MKEYQMRLARLLAESGALFFQEGLRLKDGRPTPYFINLGVFRTGRLAWQLGQCYAEWMDDEGLAEQVELIVGPSYKGSAIAQGAAIALYEKFGLDVAYDYDRKEAKTHGEATGHGVLFVTGAALEGGKTLILDDVGTSMTTKLDLIKKLRWLKPRLTRPMEIMGVALAVDREQTQAVYDGHGRVREGVKGPDAVNAFTEESGLPVWSLLGVRQAVDYLHQEGHKVLIDGEYQHLSHDQLDQLNEYFEIYGK